MSADGASWPFGRRAAHTLDERKVPAPSLMIITKTLECYPSPKDSNLNLADFIVYKGHSRGVRA